LPLQSWYCSSTVPLPPTQNKTARS
jgi:hypothetical protein